MQRARHGEFQLIAHRLLGIVGGGLGIHSDPSKTRHRWGRIREIQDQEWNGVASFYFPLPLCTLGKRCLVSIIVSEKNAVHKQVTNKIPSYFISGSLAWISCGRPK